MNRPLRSFKIGRSSGIGEGHWSLVPNNDDWFPKGGGEKSRVAGELEEGKGTRP